MTKKEMIEKIQKAEAKAWRDLQEAKAVFGPEDATTVRLRINWSAIYELKEALGIDSMTIAKMIENNLLPA